MIREVYDLSELARATHESKWGRFNDAPPEWEEITEAQLVKETPWRIYAPTLYEYRQILPKRDHPSISMGPMFEARLFYFEDGTGVGMHCDSQTGKIRWFRFGCKHDMETWWPVMFERHDKCKKCGYEAVYDTSG